MAAEVELAAATPALEAAKEAVAGLDKSALQEFKSFGKAPTDCEKITGICMVWLDGELKAKKYLPVAPLAHRTPASRQRDSRPPDSPVTGRPRRS